jgi:hypothetical protein
MISLPGGNMNDLTIRVLIADDHGMVREGLSAIIREGKK